MPFESFTSAFGATTGIYYLPNVRNTKALLVITHPFITHPFVSFFPSLICPFTCLPALPAPLFPCALLLFVPFQEGYRNFVVSSRCSWTKSAPLVYVGLTAAAVMIAGLAALYASTSNNLTVFIVVSASSHVMPIPPSFANRSLLLLALAARYCFLLVLGLRHWHCCPWLLLWLLVLPHGPH